MDCILDTASQQRRTRKHSGLPTAGLDVPRRSIGNHRIAGRSSFVPPELPLYPMVRRFLAVPFAEGTVDHRTALALLEHPLAARLGLCERCVELDAKIERYERLARMITDEQALAAIGQEIERANAEKAALHPEPEA